MHCVVYRSSRKTDTYLYLVQKDRFDLVPEPLRRMFGPASLVMELALRPERPLAREDVRQVMAALLARGWFLQMPRQEPDSCDRHH